MLQRPDEKRSQVTSLSDTWDEPGGSFEQNFSMILILSFSNHLLTDLRLEEMEKHEIRARPRAAWPAGPGRRR